MSTRERKLRFIETFSHGAVETGAAELLRIMGDDWLTDEQLADIADYYVGLRRRQQRLNRQNQAIYEARKRKEHAA